MKREKPMNELIPLIQPAVSQTQVEDGHSASALCPISLQVPLRGNDGVPFGPELQSVVNLLDQRFGGVTVFRECMGAWQGQHEPSWRLEVAVECERIEEVVDAAVSIGRRLGQRALYVTVGLPTVRIIEINGLNRAHEGAGKSDGPRETDIVGCARRT